MLNYCSNPSKHGLLSLITSPYPVYCRSGGSMMWTAVATYRPRSWRWSDLRFNKSVQLKDRQSVDNCSSLHRHASPLAASPSLSTFNPKFQREDAFEYKCHITLLIILSFLCCFHLCFVFQAFLGDLFQQHHKDLSADKLEEYTDTMVALDFISVFICKHFSAALTSLCCWRLVETPRQKHQWVAEAFLDWLDHYGNCLEDVKIFFPPLYCQLSIFLSFESFGGFFGFVFCQENDSTFLRWLSLYRCCGESPSVSKIKFWQTVVDAQTRGINEPRLKSAVASGNNQWEHKQTQGYFLFIDFFDLIFLPVDRFGSYRWKSLTKTRMVVWTWTTWPGEFLKYFFK